MEFLEKDLEDVLFFALNDKDNFRDLKDRGLETLTSNGMWIKRQLRIGNYGIADIVTASYFGNDIDDQSLHITIYELKKDIIDVSTLVQCSRYVKGVKRFLKKRGFKHKASVSMVLIGRRIDTSDWVYLLDELPNVSAFTYQYNFDGISFEDHSSFYLMEDGFQVKKQILDPF